MTARLILLGSKGGPAIRPGGPNPTSNLVETGGRRIVVDCGLGVTRGLVDAGMHLRALDLIVITHLHSDHVLELGALIHTAWTAGLSTPVEVHAPDGIETVWAGFLDMMRYDIETRIEDEGRPDLRDLVRLNIYSEGSILDTDGLRLTARRNHHPPVTESYALRVDAGAVSVVFSGDTAPFDGLAEFTRGADVLVHEAMLASGIDRLVARTANGARLRQHLLASHSFAADAGGVATEAGVGRLVLNHLIPADDPEITAADWERAVRTTWSGPLAIATDGLTIEIGRPGRAAAE